MLRTQIDDDVYLLIGEAYHSNSTAFVSQGEVLLVDALGSLSDAEDLKEFVETELEKEVRFILCTHFFSDHLAALKLFPRATVCRLPGRACPRSRSYLSPTPAKHPGGH